MTPADLFDEIVRICDLSEVLGPGLVRRALSDVGMVVEEADADGWRRALPHLRKRLEAYFPEEEVQARLRRIESLLEEAAGSTTLAVRGGSDGDYHTPNPD
ncbi:MAG: hypothetical protein ACODAU_10290 [Myxococcota bacterium]